MDRHHEETEVKLIVETTDEDEQTRLKSLLRLNGNHSHNSVVKNRGCGEIMLSRRPQAGPYILGKYAVCPSCFTWVSNLLKHRSYSKICHGRNGEPLFKKVAPNSKSRASPMLEAEVLVKMTDDQTPTIIKNDLLLLDDPLLLELGNNAPKKNIKNRLRRGVYAIPKMRLSARLLLELRTILNSDTCTFDEILIPSNYA